MENSEKNSGSLTTNLNAICLIWALALAICGGVLAGSEKESQEAVPLKPVATEKPTMGTFEKITTNNKPKTTTIIR